MIFCFFCANFRRWLKVGLSRRRGKTVLCVVESASTGINLACCPECFLFFVFFFRLLLALAVYLNTLRSHVFFSCSAV